MHEWILPDHSDLTSKADLGTLNFFLTLHSLGGFDVD